METAQIEGLCQDSRLPFSIDKDHEKGSKKFRSQCVFCSIAPWIMLFSNRVNSWLKYRKERTESNIKTMGLS